MDIQQKIEQELDCSLEFDIDLEQYIGQVVIKKHPILCQFEMQNQQKKCSEERTNTSSHEELLAIDYSVLQEILKDIDILQNLALACLQQLANPNETPDFALPDLIAIYPNRTFTFGYIAQDPELDSNVIISVQFSASFVPSQKLSFDIM